MSRAAGTYPSGVVQKKAYERICKGHRFFVTDVVLLPTGKVVVSSDDRTLGVWNPEVRPDVGAEDWTLRPGS